MGMVIEPQPVPLRADEMGVVRVAGTRVTLDTVVAAFRNGTTAEEIAQQYPTVPLADLYSVIGYYLRHRSQVEGYLDQRRVQRDAVRHDMEAKHDPAGIRDRLLARQTRLGREA